MAQAYLDYACIGVVTQNTINQIDHLLVCNGAYTYFRLQLAIMCGDTSQVSCIGENYDWIDFVHTEKECKRFLSQLRNT